MLSGLVAMPYTAYVIAVSLIPGLDAITSRYLQRRLVLIVVIVAVLSFLAGSFHPYILTCDDFGIAGSHVPRNCWNGQ